MENWTGFQYKSLFNCFIFIQFESCGWCLQAEKWMFMASCWVFHQYQHVQCHYFSPACSEHLLLPVHLPYGSRYGDLINSQDKKIHSGVIEVMLLFHSLTWVQEGNTKQQIGGKQTACCWTNLPRGTTQVQARVSKPVCPREQLLYMWGLILIQLRKLTTHCNASPPAVIMITGSEGPLGRLCWDLTLLHTLVLTSCVVTADGDGDIAAETLGNTS